jgi:NADPH:quinone reductase-like Zn-dependent oxidoreductase
LVAASGGQGADIVVETGGLATLSQSITAAAPNGRLVMIGALAGVADQVLPNFSSVIGKNLTLRGITAGNRRMLAELVGAAAACELVPVIDRVFAFADAPAAYAHLRSGEHIGKVMIEM